MENTVGTYQEWWPKRAGAFRRRPTSGKLRYDTFSENLVEEPLYPYLLPVEINGVGTVLPG